MDNQLGESPVTIASPDPGEIDPLGDALAALERRDYATAQRLFEALGRKDAAEGIKDALAALDRRDYAAAQGLFDALSLKGSAAARAKGSASANPKPRGPRRRRRVGWRPTPRDRARPKSGASPLEVIPTADAALSPAASGGKDQSAQSRGRSCSAQAWFCLRSSAPRLIHGSPLNWTFAGMKNQAIAGLASAVDVLKAPLEAIRGPSEEERSAMRDLRAALTQATIRLDRIEQEYGARLDKLGQRIDQDTSSQICRYCGEARQSGEKSRRAGCAWLRICRCRSEARQVGEESRRRGWTCRRIGRDRDEAQQAGEVSRRRDPGNGQAPPGRRAETIDACGESGTFRLERDRQTRQHEALAPGL